MSQLMEMLLPMVTTVSYMQRVYDTYTVHMHPVSKPILVRQFEKPDSV